MSKVLLLSAAIVTLVIGGVSGYALYRVVQGDSFGVELNSDDNMTSLDVSLTEMIPGKQKSFTYDVKNTSITSDLVVEFVYKDEQGLLPYLSTKIPFDDETEYDGLLKDLTDNQVKTVIEDELKVSISYSLPLETDNSTMGKALDFALVFKLE